MSSTEKHSIRTTLQTCITEFYVCQSFWRNFKRQIRSASPIHEHSFVLYRKWELRRVVSRFRNCHYHYYHNIHANFSHLLTNPHLMSMSRKLAKCYFRPPETSDTFFYNVVSLHFVISKVAEVIIFIAIIVKF